LLARFSSVLLISITYSPPPPPHRPTARACTGRVSVSTAVRGSEDASAVLPSSVLGAGGGGVELVYTWGVREGRRLHSCRGSGAARPCRFGCSRRLPPRSFPPLGPPPHEQGRAGAHPSLSTPPPPLGPPAFRTSTEVRAGAAAARGDALCAGLQGAADAPGRRRRLQQE